MRLPKKFRRQAKKQLKEKRLREIDEYLEDVRKRMKEGILTDFQQKSEEE